MSFSSHTSKGIILSLSPALHNVSYISLLTKDQGLIDIKTRIPSKLQHRNSGKLEPFTVGEFQLYTRSATPTLQEIHNAQNQVLISITPNQLYLLNYFVKITKKIFPKEQAIPLTYQAWETILDNLNSIPSKILTLFFLRALIKQAGIMPNLKTCENNQALNNTCYFDPSRNSLNNQAQNINDLKVELNTRKLVHNLNNLELINSLNINHETRNNCLLFLVNVIGSYTHTNPQGLMPPSEQF